VTLQQTNGLWLFRHTGAAGRIDALSADVHSGRAALIDKYSLASPA
jgi:hypothetical protein